MKMVAASKLPICKLTMEYVCSRAVNPEPSAIHVASVSILDEVADTKETVLHVVDKLYVEHVRQHQKRWLVLEGDAKPMKSSRHSS